MIGARIYLRLVIQDLPLIASDILVCTAWTTSVVSASFDIVFHKLGVLRPYVSYTLEGFRGTPEEVEFVWKLQWGGQFPFFTAFYLCKATLLTLYAHFFPAFMQTRRKILWGTMAFCGCAYLTTILTMLTICRPIEGNWSSDPAVACSPIVFAQVFYVGWALNFAGDLMKLWSILDLQTGLVIACIPPLRPYLSHTRTMWPFRLANKTPKESENRSELSEVPQHHDRSRPRREEPSNMESVDDLHDLEGRSVSERDLDAESSALASPKSPMSEV
ncbi:hypothetical protein CSHISOI_07300, partial [Colletotrichum shisoi]